MRGRGGRGTGSQPMSTAVHMEPKLNFGDLTPCLTCYEKTIPTRTLFLFTNGFPAVGIK
jgi:hypothetical protein